MTEEEEASGEEGTGEGGKGELKEEVVVDQKTMLLFVQHCWLFIVSHNGIKVSMSQFNFFTWLPILHGTETTEQQ